MKEQKEELNQKIDEMGKKIEQSIDRKLEQQTKEIADLIHEIIAHMEDKSRKSEKKLDEEILSNKIEHNSYNARFKKIEDELKYKHA